MQSSGGGNTLYHPKDSLHNSGPSTHRNSYVAKEVEERTHRRYSLQNDSSLVNGHDVNYRDGVLPNKNRRLPHLNLHDHKRRNSISVLPSDSSNLTTGPGTRRGDEINPLPTRSSFPTTLPIANERQTDIDLDSFRLARACGMTLDTISMAKPRLMPTGAGKADNGGAESRQSSIEELSNSVNYESSDMRHPRQREKTSSSQMRERPHSSFERQSCHDNAVIHGAHSSPSSPTAPAFARRSGTSLRPNRPAPPFSPQLDPHKQLALLDGLLKAQHVSFSANDPLASYGPATVENLIDINRLLKEHEVDSKLDERRRELERSESGLDFYERFEKSRVNDGQSNGTIWRSPMSIVGMKKSEYYVFGQPLSLTRMYASCVCSMAGYQHDLPIVVYACVEELYRTGMTVAGLFRSPPDILRHRELIEIFDNGPSFGRSRSLSKETTADVGALLRSYIDRLPRAIWHETLFDPMLRLCVRPSLQVEKALAEASENEELHSGMASGQTRKARPTSLILPTTPVLASTKKQHARSSSLHDVISYRNPLLSPALSAMARTEVDISREKPQLIAAKALFRLLPRAQLALLAYLCAFFTQLPLCPHNQLAIEDIARFFAIPLFLGKADGATVPITTEAWNARKGDAQKMMVWILKRWTHISEGLFDVEDIRLSDGEAEREPESASSSDNSESVQTTFSNPAWTGSDMSALSTPPCSPHNASEGQSSKVLEGDKCEDLQSRQSGETDITAWKSHVEKDIDELKRALTDVRAHLQK